MWVIKLDDARNKRHKGVFDRGGGVGGGRTKRTGESYMYMYVYTENLTVSIQ